MSREQSGDRISEIVGDALELEGEAQASFLDSVCGDDAALRLEVESLLAVGRSQEAEGFLAVPAPEQLAAERLSGLTVGNLSAGGTSSRGVSLPSSIGPYRVLEALGQGGMGTVYLAQQVEPVERKVALKVMRGLFAGSSKRRFARESQTLARLNHPNIAALYEVGSTGEAPYVAMEWVEGFPITAWCDRERLSLTERLQIFRGVCAGTQHAHEKGILHCDLKPSNVLVTSIDGEAVAKVIDFGIARALGDPVTSESAELVLGSPPYISPEALSAEGRRGLGARTDVYSLGLILYELLVGVLPFSSESRQSFLAFMRQVTEQEPLAPSQRFAGLPAIRSEAVAERRGLGAPHLRRHVAGDLDAIVLKAIARDPKDRFGSVSELLAEIERHRARRPVEARLPNRAYVAGRFARRHRTVVVAGFLLLVALVGGLIARSIEAHRAQQALAESEQVRQFLVDLFESGNPEAASGEVFTVRDLLDQGTLRLREDLADQPLARARFLHSIGAIYLRLDELYAAAEVIGEALALRRRHHGAGHPEVIESESEMGVLLRRLGRYDEAEVLLQSVLTARQADPDVDPELLARAYSNLGNLYWSAERFEEAERIHRSGLAVRERNTRRLRTPEARMDEAYSANNLAVMLLTRRKYAESLAPLERALELFETDNPVLRGSALNNLGLVHRNLPSWAEAEGTFRDAIDVLDSGLGSKHARPLSARRNLIFELVLRHRWEEALNESERALQLAETVDDRLTLAQIVRTRARVLRLAGKADLAVETARRSRAIAVAEQGPEQPLPVSCRTELALALAARGELTAAVDELRAVAEIQGRLLPPDHRSRLRTERAFGIVYLEADRGAEAVAHLRGALTIERQTASKNQASGPSRVVAETLLLLGRALLVEDLEEGVTSLEEALATLRKVLGDRHPLVAEAAFHLGRAERQRGRRDEARKLLAESVAIRQAVYPADDADLAASRRALAELDG
ncbi:MAG: serine/threonine-protein kinase [Acidobacteriota bacterium]